MVPTWDDDNNSTCVRRIDSWANRRRRCGGVHARCNGMATESLLVESIRKTGFTYDVASIAKFVLSFLLSAVFFFLSPPLRFFHVFLINRETLSCHGCKPASDGYRTSSLIEARCEWLVACRTSFRAMYGKDAFRNFLIIVFEAMNRCRWEEESKRWLNWIFSRLDRDRY